MEEERGRRKKEKGEEGERKNEELRQYSSKRKRAERAYLKLEGRVGGDDGGEATSTVSVVRGASEHRLLSQRELRDAFVPSLNDAANADLFVSRW